MKKQHKHWAKFFSILGTVLSIVVGFGVMVLIPVLNGISDLKNGDFSILRLAFYILILYLAPTVGGTIWCAFDILATHVENEPHDDDI